jgi:hypothetical protein
MKVRSVPRQKKSAESGARPLALPPELTADRPQAPRRPGLRVEAPAVREAAREIAALGAGLGLELDGDEEEQLLVEIDPRAPVIAEAQALVLPGAPGVEQASGRTGADLLALKKQFSAMGSFHRTAAQLDRDYEDSRRVMGSAQRQLREEIRDLVQRLMQEKGLRPDLQERLETAWRHVEGVEERIAARKEERRDESEREERRHAAGMEAAARRETLIETMLDLRQDRPVADEEVAAAYEDLGGEEAERRDAER